MEERIIDKIKSAIVEAARGEIVLVEQTKEGVLKISPIKSPKLNPAMTCKEIGDEWILGLYDPNKEENWNKLGIKYVIPWEKFNPNNIEESLKYNIVK